MDFRAELVQRADLVSHLLRDWDVWYRPLLDPLLALL